MEIPGVHLAGWGVLPAGTYVFKILDSGADRHIVQISSQDELTVYATILAIPNYRLKATDKTVITFSEDRPACPRLSEHGSIRAITWARSSYIPRPRALSWPSRPTRAVLYTPAEITPEVTTPIQSAEEPVVVELKQAPVMAVKPSGRRGSNHRGVTAPPAEALVAENQAPVPEQTLPKTASPMPLIGLLGLLALSAALALRVVRERAF